MNGTDEPRAGSNHSADWLTPGRFASLLGVILCALFFDVIFGGRTFFHHDFATFGYPLAHYYRESFWRGEIPFWNPFSNCGLPFMAQWNTLTFYPGSLIYLLLPLPWSLNLFGILHLFVAGLGMYLLAFRWVGSRLGAGVAGFILAFNGLAQFCLVWPNNVAALAWMPWVVLLVERGWREGGKHLALAALVGAVQMLSGAPELILFTWFIVGCFFLRSLICEGGRAWMLFRFASIMGLVFGLAAVQMFPFLDLLRHSQRHEGYSSTIYSIPALGWANFVVPLFQNFAERNGVYFQVGQYWTASYYTGIVALALGLAGLQFARTSRKWVLAGLGLFGVLMALGINSPVYPVLRKILPQLGFVNFPVKFVALAVFCLPLLAAMGTSEIEKAKKRSQWRFIFLVSGILAAVAAGAVLFERFFPEPFTSWKVTLESAVTRVALLLLALGVLRYTFRDVNQRTRILLQMAFLILIALDLWTYAPNQMPRINASILRPDLIRDGNTSWPKVGESRAWIDRQTHYNTDHSKLTNAESHIIGLRLRIHANCNLLDHVPKGNGFFSLYLRDMDAVKGLADAGSPPKMPGLFNLLSVSHLPKRDELDFKPREGWLPIITAGQKPVFTDAAIHLLGQSDFNPREVVLLPSEAKSAVAITNSSQMSVSMRQFSANRIEFDVDGQEPGLVVLSQAYYHPWRAKVDGASTPIWKANAAFQALQVPGGRHRVELVYRDQYFLFGAIMSIASLFVCAAILVWPRRPPSP